MNKCEAGGNGPDKGAAAATLYSTTTCIGETTTRRPRQTANNDSHPANIIQSAPAQRNSPQP